ncbi:MAG: AmmeMemoRadiSam system protein A [Firmicutes bacterium]|nr:AmmeMemoRadiSam system protein A [Bacillota bacterium]
MPIVGGFIVPHPPLIVHEVGKGQERKIHKTIEAYEEIGRRIKKLKPDIIVMSTPHSVMYSNYLHISPGQFSEGSFRDFGAPHAHYEVSYCTEFIQKLSDLSKSEGIPAGTLGEKKKQLDHGVLVPLSFIKKEYQNFKFVRVSISGLSLLTHYKFGKLIASISNQMDQRVVFVASGDLSHKLLEEGPYGFSEDGPLFDQRITQALSTGDFYDLLNFEDRFCESAGECGLRSFIILSGVLDGLIVRSELLSYEGPFGVGYAVASYEPIGYDDSRKFDERYEEVEKERLSSIRINEDPYVRLARLSLEHYIKKGVELAKPNNILGEMLETKAGVFVSLKKDGMLRGCIGTTAATTKSVADEIIQNAISAGLRDPRFDPVKEDELSQIIYSVDVLTPSKPIANINDLDPKKFGVIVRSHGKSGLLLPDLEGIDSPEKQVEIALRKAGISENEKYSLERFEVIRHH